MPPFNISIAERAEIAEKKWHCDKTFHCGFHVFWAIITEGFDRYGHNWRTFFKKFRFFSRIEGKEIIIFVDKVVCV